MCTQCSLIVFKCIYYCFKDNSYLDRQIIWSCFPFIRSLCFKLNIFDWTNDSPESLLNVWYLLNICLVTIPVDMNNVRPCAYIWKWWVSSSESRDNMWNFWYVTTVVFTEKTFENVKWYETFILESLLFNWPENVWQ